MKEVTGGVDCPAFVLPKSSSDIAEMKKVAKDLIGGTTCAGSLGSSSERSEVFPLLHVHTWMTPWKKLFRFPVRTVVQIST